MTSSLNKSRYIMIGGFLGAGKSTALTAFGHYLQSKGYRVGLISNDQGQKLVDTAYMRAEGFAVEEIGGGCFCCRFNSLMEAAENLRVEEAPEYFLAEPVGSCTDLIASVSYPLRRIYGESFSVAALSVMLDPLRALKVLGVEEGKNFSETVLYVYKKQLEEARFIVINKIDLLDEQRLNALEKALAEQYPKADILKISLRNKQGCEDWFEKIINSEFVNDPVLDIDYDDYAEAEAELGWLNATVNLKAKEELDGNEFILDVMFKIQEKINKQSSEIAHLKLTLSPQDGSGEIAVANVVANDKGSEMSHELLDDLDEGQLIINLRAEAKPENLKKLVEEAIALCEDDNINLSLDHLECFAPARPSPTHRMTNG